MSDSRTDEITRIPKDYWSDIAKGECFRNPPIRQIYYITILSGLEVKSRRGKHESDIG